MTHLEIIRRVAAECKMPVKACRAVVDLFWEQVVADLEGKAGKAVIGGFGIFRKKLRQPKVSHPPSAKGGEAFSPSHYAVSFKPSKSRRKGRKG